jgi:hypothetical protein
MDTTNYTKILHEFEVILSKGVSTDALEEAITKVEELMNNPVRPLTKQEEVILKCMHQILMNPEIYVIE